MKSYRLLLAVTLIFTPSLSFAEPNKDYIINVHPKINRELREQIYLLIDKMADDKLNISPQYKMENKKLENLKIQLDALDAQEKKRQASLSQCWAACPDVIYGNDNYYCNFSQRCNQCGGNCNSRFLMARDDIAKKREMLESQINELDSTLSKLLMDNETNKMEYQFELIENFERCVYGTTDTDYTSLDECLRAHAWNRTSK